MKVFRLPRWFLPRDRALEGQLEHFSSAVEDGGRRLEAIPFLDGILKESITFLADVEVDIYHELKRQIRGWIVTRNRVNSFPVLLKEVSSDENKLTLYSWSDAVVDIWIF